MNASTEQKPGESLDSFVNRVVKPTADEMKSLREDVDRFASFLRNGFSYEKYTVAEVLKSGSLGKGTATKDSDIDLVVFINGIQSIAQLIRVRPELLEVLRQQVAAYSEWRGRVKLKKVTQYSVSYYLTKSYGGLEVTHEVDILPAITLFERKGRSVQEFSPDPATLYQSIGFTNLHPLSKSARYRRNKKGQKYSVSLAPLQIAFMEDFFRDIELTRSQEIREKVKDVIRLLKYWKKKNHLGIRPYSLELLTVDAYNNTRWTSMADLFRAVLTRLTTCGRLCVDFDNIYQPKVYTSYRGPPYVLDPANPLMNTLGGIDCGAVQRAARATLLQ